jgi:MFS family permease
VAIVQWVPLAYLVAITSSLVISGRAADLWGSRRVYVGGLLTFVLGSALSGAAPTALSLVVCRGVQGLGAAMLLSSGQALMAEVFPEEQRGRALAWMHVAVALGFTLGPAIGGVLVEAIGCEGQRRSPGLSRRRSRQKGPPLLEHAMRSTGVSHWVRGESVTKQESCLPVTVLKL